MSTVSNERPLPDPVRMVADFLRGQPELAAVGERVYSELPAVKLFPFLLVRRATSRPLASRPWYAETATIDVMVCGSTHAEMADVAEQVRFLMATRAHGDHPRGTVVAVEVMSLTDATDTDLPPYDDGRPRRRAVASFNVTYHPSPTPAAPATSAAPATQGAP